MTPPGPTGAAAIRAIYQRYREKFEQQYDDIQGAVAAAVEGRLDEAGAELGRRQAHKLAGAGGTFGLPRVSEAARELEALLGPNRQEGPLWADRLSHLSVDLRTALDAGPQDTTPATSSSSTADKAPLLLVASDDAAMRAKVAREAEVRGLAVQQSSIAGGPELSRRPAVALVGGVDADPDGLRRTLSALATMDPPVPTIVLTSTDSQVDRVEVARLGGRGFLPLPIDARRALDAAQEVLEAHRLEGIRILAVDDDPSVLEVVATLLDAEGVSVTTLADPSRFWQVLQEVAPDQLILDVDMPGVSGIELCRAVRNDPRWSQLSVLFLTGITDANVVEEVFSAGADDYVTKPINHRELVMRISNRLERFRLYRRLAETDPLTGTANRRKAMETLDRLRGLADRYHEAFSLAVIDLDHFKSVNDDHGHLAGDEVLRSLGARLRGAFRGQDLVARWGGEEFLVAMYGMRRADAVHRVAEVLEAQRAVVHRDGEGARFQTTFSAGVAQYDMDGTSTQELFRAADQALYAAKEAGRNRVLDVGRATSMNDPGPTDVVLVEDDEAVASALVDALETRGWTAEWIDDGREAVRQLAGDPPALRARLVVLGWELPGLEGPEVLRELARAGRLADTQVIMVTSRSSIDDIELTESMGAVEHVVKPFSMPVLLQRIRRLLDDG